MPDPTLRANASDGSSRLAPTYLLSVAFVLVLAAVPTALAQGMVDPSCPPTAWCHPDGSGLSYIEDAASDVGSDLVRRRETGDCTGLGPEGCLGVLLNQLMCAIDGRDWVQQYACAPGPVESPPAGGGGAGGGAGGGGAAPPAETPAPPPSEKPDSDEDTEALAAAVAPGIGRWLREALDDAAAGERLARVPIGDRANLELVVWGRYERERGNVSAFFAIVRAIDSVDGRQRLIIIGVRGDLVYVGDVERLRAGNRRGTPPNSPNHVLALGGH